MLKQILIFLFLTVPAVAQRPSANSELNNLISSIPKTTRISLSVYDLDTHSFLFKLNQDTPLKPASNMKILTAGAALLYLKPEYRLSTFIYCDASRINNGVLEGDLYFKGGGNPSLNENDLKTLAEKIRATGIKKITGRVTYDNSLFPIRMQKKEFLKDLSPIVLPSISPLSINNNIISVSKKNGKIVPSINSRYVKLIVAKTGSNKIEESKSGVTILFNPSALNNTNSAIHYFIKNPPLLAALLLKEKCSNLGIEINGVPKPGKTPAGLREISTGTELINIVKDINSNSNNFYSETLYETLKALLNSNNSTEKILSLFGSNGTDLKGSIISDGSGISSGNRLSALTLVSVLKKISEDGKIGSGFKQTLAAAGISGTLKELYSNSIVKGSFYGKSGFMAGVSSLSGYLKTKTGRNLIISLIFNFSEKDINYYREVERKIVEGVYLKN